MKIGNLNGGAGQESIPSNALFPWQVSGAGALPQGSTAAQIVAAFKLRQQQIITQNAHGFAVGYAIYKNAAGTWVRSDATAEATGQADAIVVAVTDVNTFVIGTAGDFFATPNGLSANMMYVLDDTASGANYIAINDAGRPQATGNVYKELFRTNAAAQAIIVLGPSMVLGDDAGAFAPTITNPQDGQVIKRVGGVWVNAADETGGAGATADAADRHIVTGSVASSLTPAIDFSALIAGFMEVVIDLVITASSTDGALQFGLAADGSTFTDTFDWKCTRENAPQNANGSTAIQLMDWTGLINRVRITILMPNSAVRYPVIFEGGGYYGTNGTDFKGAATPTIAQTIKGIRFQNSNGGVTLTIPYYRITGYKA